VWSVSHCISSGQCHLVPLALAVKLAISLCRKTVRIYGLIAKRGTTWSVDNSEILLKKNLLSEQTGQTSLMQITVWKYFGGQTRRGTGLLQPFDMTGPSLLTVSLYLFDRPMFSTFWGHPFKSIIFSSQNFFWYCFYNCSDFFIQIIFFIDIYFVYININTSFITWIIFLFKKTYNVY